MDHIQVPIDLPLVLTLMQNPLSSKQMKTDRFFTQKTDMELNEIHLLVPLTYILSKGRVIQCIRSQDFGQHKGTLKFSGQHVWDLKEMRQGMQNKAMFTTVIETRTPFEKETRKVVVKYFKVGLRDGKKGKKSESGLQKVLQDEKRKTMTRNECLNFAE